MQSSFRNTSLQSACSPPLKKHSFSGYPSPPSSGCNENEEGEVQDVNSISKTAGGLLLNEEIDPQALHHVRGRTVEVESRVIEKIVEDDENSEKEEEYDTELGRNEREDEQADIEDDLTLTMRSRSDSIASSSATIRSSNSSGSITALPHLKRKREEGDSPHNSIQNYVGPIRDTPRNPFLEGGPADVGHAGPYGHSRLSQMAPHFRERGKMTYVFRGQRVTYADPYASDSDDDEGQSSTRGCMLDRLQPKLLFPSMGKANVRPTPVFERPIKAPTKASMKRRPTLDMTLEYQRCNPEAQSKWTSRQDLLERVEQVEWSDEEDNEHQEYPHQSQYSQNILEQQEKMREVNTSYSEFEDEEYKNDKMEEQEENPFMSSSTSAQVNAPFVNRLFHMQTCSTSHSRGVIRSSHQHHRFNPYSKQ